MSDGRHVEPLFSAACESELSDTDRHAFDEHLRNCPRCSRLFADFTTAVDAVRSLPPARMPVAVRVPQARPQSAWPRVELLLSAGRRLLRPRVGWGTAVGLLAAAGILVVALRHPGTATSPPGASSISQASGAAAASGCAPAAIGPSASAYANRVVATSPNSPGQQLVLASSSSAYSAGSQVTVYAAVTAPLPQSRPVGATPLASPPVVTIPACVQVVVDGATQPPGVPAGAVADSGSSGSAPIQAPAGGTAAPAGTVVVSIPAGLPPGTVVRLVATAPGGSALAGNPPLRAELTVTVR